MFLYAFLYESWIKKNILLYLWIYFIIEFIKIGLNYSFIIMNFYHIEFKDHLWYSLNLNIVVSCSHQLYYFPIEFRIHKIFYEFFKENSKIINRILFSKLWISIFCGKILKSVSYEDSDKKNKNQLQKQDFYHFVKRLFL